MNEEEIIESSLELSLNFAQVIKVFFKLNNLESFDAERMLILAMGINNFYFASMETFLELPDEEAKHAIFKMAITLWNKFRENININE